jgi:hypothetical protein
LSPEGTPLELEEISIDLFDDEGNHICKELERVYLTKGAWTTILFKYAELDKKTGELGEPKATIRRYQKTGGEYRQRSKFNISSAAQGKDLAKQLLLWFEVSQ